MTTWASDDLLLEFNQQAGRPPSGDSVTDAAKYARLTRAQSRVVADVAARCPKSLYQKVAYGSLPALVTTDNQVFTFGTDSNGYAVFPIGKAIIFPTLAAFPTNPWTEGRDYINEGTQIRIPNNRTWTSPLYWYGIQQPADIDATHQPALFPEGSRELIVFEAVRSFATEANRNPELRGVMVQEYGTSLARWCLVWKTQFRSGGALGGLTGLRLAEMGISTNG